MHQAIGEDPRNSTGGTGQESRAARKAGVARSGVTVLLVANLETRLVGGRPAAVAGQLGVPLWLELGCDAGADGAAANALADSLTRAASKHSGAVALVA